MKVIYIAGPFRGKHAWAVEQNIRHAEELAFEVACLGAMPMCPHTNTRFFDGTIDGQFWLDGTLEMMRRCDAVMLTDDWRASSGARNEVAVARTIPLPVFVDLETLCEWLESFK